MLVGGVMAKGKKVLKNLTVDEKRMRQNLDILEGLMMSEQVMLKLGEKIGKQTAHQVVNQVSMEAFEQQTSFKEKLLANEIVAANMTEAELDGLLDPEQYTGQCAAIARNVSAAIRTKRQDDER